jgi:UDP-2,4-diacetamido-2,4,6-trideoxy-beta-L-altropyranose hydrolase
MNWADFAISAGGSTVWELAMMKLPSFILVTDKNQKKSSIELIKRNLFNHIKISELKTISLLRKKIIRFAKNKKLRYKLSHQAKSIVDGKGAFRICCALKK